MEEQILVQEWDYLINLILNSIQIIGVFIAIIIGFIISKVMDLKKEKEELKNEITDIDNELEILNKHFYDLKEKNYLSYKFDYVDEIVESIIKNEQYVFYDNIPYISLDDQKNFYYYVKEYYTKLEEFLIKKLSKEECFKKLKVIPNSIEETIIDSIYFWREE